MQIVCTDGTMIECTSFRATDSGVLLFDEAIEEEEEPEAIGFVPIPELKFVLSDELLEQIGMSPAPSEGAPPQQMPPQQQSRQAPPPQQSSPPQQGRPQPMQTGGEFPAQQRPDH